MVKKSTKQKLAAMLTALALAPCINVCSVTAGTRVTNAAMTPTVAVQTVRQTGIKEIYDLGETFTVPESEKTVDGVSATAVLVFPSGRAVSKTNIVLDEVGKYELRYDFYKDGKIIDRDTETFAVYQKTYEVSGEGTAQYSSGDGLKVVLPKNTKIIFNELLNVSDLRMGAPFISVDITPETNDVLDFNNLFFKLIDANDPGNYITIDVHNSFDSLYYFDNDPYKGNSYALAGASNQSMTGWEQGNGGKLHIANEWGAPVPLSFWGQSGKQNLKLEFDAQTFQIYANDQFVVDLDDRKYFPEPWSGFESDKIRLEIYAEDYMQSAARFNIKSVTGVSINNKYIVNSAEPFVNIALENGVAPDGLKGFSYPVPNVVATDSRGRVCKVAARVYYDYDNVLARKEISVYNERFATEQSGAYSVIYTVIDVYGTKYTQRVDVAVKDSLPPLSVSATMDGRRSSAYVGETVTVGKILSTGGSGTLTLSTEAVVAGEKLTVTDGKFIPTKVGKYAIVYTATDFIGRTANYVYNMSVDYSADPVLEQVEMPRSLLGGFTCDIPIPRAFVYSTNGRVESLVETSVEVDGQTYAVDNGKLSVPIVANETVAQVKYRSGNTTEEYEIPIKPVKTAEGNIIYSNLFLTDGGVRVQQDTRGVRLVANNDGYAEFSSGQVGDGFNINFALPFGLQSCEGIELLLHDSVNPDEQVRIKFYETSHGNIGYSINGGIGKSMAYALGETLVFTIEKSGITFNANMQETLKYFANGKVYKGFSSGLVKMQVSFIGVDGNTELDIMSIGRQNFRADAQDNRAPNIGLLGSTVMLHKMNDVVILPAAVCADVVNPQSKFTLTCKTPSGEIVTAKDGTRLENADPSREYEIELNEYGEFSAEYKATDTANNRSASEYVRFIVENKNRIEADYAFEPITEGKVGTAVAVPKLNADESKFTVLRYLVLPNGKIVGLNDEYYDSFIPKTSGKYTVRYYVTDANGYFEIFEYSVTVAAENGGAA